jgi:superfamily I DNA/RNA helicase
MGVTGNPRPVAEERQMTTMTASARIWSGQQQDIFSWFRNDPTSLSAAITEQLKTQGRSLKALIARARAGTGKTTTIIEGVNQAPDARILLCAFNKKIAEELASRLTSTRAEAKTLHGVGYAAVRRYWEGVRLEANRGDRANSLSEAVCGPRVPDAIKRLVSQLHTKAREINPHATEPGSLLDLAYTFDCVPDEEWASEGLDVNFVEEKALAAMVLAASTKPATGIDFSDMIFLPVRNHWLTPAYDLVVVDEAQDMTVAQLEIAQGVCRGRIAIVGDDRQAIYAFRGADSESIDRLKKELNAVELGLKTTYRCGQTIVAEAQRLVPDFECGAAHEGAIEVLKADKLVEAAGPGDFILSRLNAPLVSIAMSLLRSGKRARVAGRDIGQGLRTLLRKLKARSVPALIEGIRNWEEREVHRALKAQREDKAENIHDQAEMLISLTDGAKNVDEVVARIEALFTDDGLGVAGVITCSSVHRSKGLEADKVFVLTGTLYPRGVSREEENIEYVAITRAKKVLVKVVA